MTSGAVQRAVFAVPEEQEEAFTAACWLEGCLGIEIKPAGAPGRLLVEVYCAGEVDPAWVDAAPGVERLRVDPVEDADWMAPYREHVRPFAVGRRFLLDPREPQELDAPRGERLWLRVPARSAFGTGSHESTRLVLELLERVEVRGRRVLDVGTGTGVLAFAALGLGARSAVAFDNDVIAPLHAAVNARLNSSPAALFAGDLAALAPTRGFDLALVNVVPEQILPELDALVARLTPGATALFSGILRGAGRAFLRELRRRGLVRRAARTAGEWVAYQTELA